MFSDNLVSKLIRWYLGLVIIVIVIYIAINVVVGINTFSNMSNLSKMVQDCVRVNGYLTWHDEKTLRNEIAIYEKPNNRTVDGPTILGLNKVLRNIRIYVYDPDKKIGGEFPETQGGTVDYGENPFATGSSNRLKYRKQQGQILYAGVTFDYYIIVPFGFWKTPTGGITTIEDKVEDNTIYYSSNGTQQIWGVDGRDIARLYNGEGDIDYTGATDIDSVTTTGGMLQGRLGSSETYPNSKGNIKVYLSPICCTHYYADLNNTSGYAGDD